MADYDTDTRRHDHRHDHHSHAHRKDREDRRGDWSGYENREFGTGRFGQDYGDRNRDREREDGWRDRSFGDRFDTRGHSEHRHRHHRDHDHERFDLRPRGDSRSRSRQSSAPGTVLIYEEYAVWPTSNQDEHYRRLRDRHARSLDRDYENYCRQRERQFHQDFGQWRQQRGSEDRSDSGRSTGRSNDDTLHLTRETGTTGSTTRSATSQRTRPEREKESAEAGSTSRSSTKSS